MRAILASLFVWRKCPLWLGVLAAGVACGPPAGAIIFLSTGYPDYNTTRPTGELRDSGWQYIGLWGSSIGVPIAERFFITAKHVGGMVGEKLSFGGVEYTAIAAYTSANSDLRIWKVDRPFPIHAPLYTKSDELGKRFVVMGRGGPRGAPVRNAKGELRGWRWMPRDGKVRWGENTVSEVFRHSARLGDMLKATFDRGEGPNECHVSSGDSGGPLFIEDRGVWKLAGIIYGVDDRISEGGHQGPFFAAAIFDQGGLWVGGTAQSSFQGDWPHDVPNAFYATRVSSNQEWIAEQIRKGLAEPDAPQIHSILKTPDQGCAFRFRGETGVAYRVVGSDTIHAAEWKPVEIPVQPGPGADEFQVLIPASGADRVRFFRILAERAGPPP